MGKVITFDIGLRHRQNANKKYKCTHKSITVYEQSRTVRCTFCGENIDPFDALLNLIKTWPYNEEE